MVISRTPFRVSFMGGGTDLPSFYELEEGAVVSTAIDKYVHITVNRRFDATYRLSYSKTEIREKVSEIEHPIFRVALEAQGMTDGGLELISMADVPAGTGLGSSSSFTVALLHALETFKGGKPNAETLAREACRLEIDVLKEPIGKQDQYAAATGGLRFIRFRPGGEVISEPIRCSSKTRAEFEQTLLVFFTGYARSASNILKEQKANTGSKVDVLRAMRDGAYRFKDILEGEGKLADLGALLDEGWRLKRGMATGVSSGQIDEWYERGRKAGAWGGKILGAGGGGFLMFMCHPEKRAAIARELAELRPFEVKFDELGSRIVFVG